MSLNFKTNQIISCGLLFVLKIILAGIAVFKMNWVDHGEMPYIFLALLIIYNWGLFTNKLFKKEFNKNSRRKINITINLVLFICHLFTFWQAHHNLPVEELMISLIVIVVDIILTESILDFVIEMDSDDIKDDNSKDDNSKDNNTTESRRRYPGLTRPKES